MPITLLKVDWKRGNTRIQLIVALAVMSAGMLFLVPRLPDLINESHKAYVTSVGTAIRTGAMMYRNVWMIDRSSPLLADMVMTEQGWPVGKFEDMERASLATPTDRCAGLWKSLLEVEVPTLSSEDDQNVDFQVAVVGGQCRYYHKASDDVFFIDYDTATGRVSWNIR